MSTALTLFAALLTGLAAGPAKPFKVDLNPPLGRSDMLTPDWENWTVSDSSTARTFGDVTITLKSEAPLLGRLFKPNLVYGATMASDGIYTSGPLELVIEGLAPGTHRLVTYHNWLVDTQPASFSIKIDGVVRVDHLRPTTKVHSDNDTALAYLEFEAGERPVVVRFEPEGGGGGEIILNGFEVDTSDPRRGRSSRRRPTGTSTPTRMRGR